MEQEARSSEPLKPRSARKLIRLGRVGGPHGLKGALRLQLGDFGAGSIKALGRLFVEGEGPVREYRVLECSPLSRGRARLVLEGIDSPEAALALRGAAVAAAEEDLRPGAAHEFYYYQALGCEVALCDGRVIGKIEEVFFNGANDVWVVRGGPKEVLVPVIADVVKAADFAARRVTVEAVPGLLD